ncbi:MAG TPA: sirohydrochlorin chelatase [Nitrospiria bacterium]|nr:sirohydrochlorin chelatase [Nitrospiria bacterium]
MAEKKINNNKDVWLLIGHGSRDDEGNREFLETVSEMKRRHPQRRIEAAFVELAEPGMREVLLGYRQDETARVQVLPLLLFGAGHSKTEIPEVIREAREKSPGIVFQYGTPLGIHPSLFKIVQERVREAEEKAGPIPREKTAILLIGRGSSDPDANGDMHKVARLFWEQNRYGWVETCFIGVTLPNLPEGIRRCAALGAKRIIALPYFIFTGVLIKRIQDLVSEQRKKYPEAEILQGNHMGKDPLLMELIEERFEAMSQGPVLMNCDLCKFQFPELVPDPSPGAHQEHHHGGRHHGSKNH